MTFEWWTEISLQMKQVYQRVLLISNDAAACCISSVSNVAIRFLLPIITSEVQYIPYTVVYRQVYYFTTTTPYTRPLYGPRWCWKCSWELSRMHCAWAEVSTGTCEWRQSMTAQAQTLYLTNNRVGSTYRSLPGRPIFIQVPIYQASGQILLQEGNLQGQINRFRRKGPILTTKKESKFHAKNYLPNEGYAVITSNQ